MCNNPQENVPFEFFLTSPAVSRIFFFCLSWIICEISGSTAVFWGNGAFRIFQRALTILAFFQSLFFSMRFARISMVHPWNSMDKVTAWKKVRFILSLKSDLYMTINLLTAVHTIAKRTLASLSIDKMLLQRYVN